MPEPDQKPDLRLVRESEEPKPVEVQDSQETLPMPELDEMTIAFQPWHPERQS